MIERYSRKEIKNIWEDYNKLLKIINQGKSAKKTAESMGIRSKVEQFQRNLEAGEGDVSDPNFNLVIRAYLKNESTKYLVKGAVGKETTIGTSLQSLAAKFPVSTGEFIQKGLQDILKDPSIAANQKILLEKLQQKGIQDIKALESEVDRLTLESMRDRKLTRIDKILERLKNLVKKLRGKKFYTSEEINKKAQEMIDKKAQEQPLP